MKKLFYLLFAFSFFFLSCEEENDPFNPTSSFSCKVDGIQLSDSDPNGRMITNNSAYNGALEFSGTSHLKDGDVSIRRLALELTESLQPS